MSFYLKQETNDYLLQETGDKIILQEGASLSPSPSVSVSASISFSPSSSFSASPSTSVSASNSPSPSLGYSVYSREGNGVLPADDTDLGTIYTESEEELTTRRNFTYVGQTGILEYMIHQFKSFVGTHTFCTVEWEGRSSLSAVESPVYLQIYNHSDNVWETVDSNNETPQDINLELTHKIADLSDYKENQVISCRVYQMALE